MHLDFQFYFVMDIHFYYLAWALSLYTSHNIFFTEKLDIRFPKVDLIIYAFSLLNLAITYEKLKYKGW